MIYQVRRTLASSIHELGVILGKEVAAKDLVPIFNGFIKVKIHQIISKLFDIRIETCSIPYLKQLQKKNVN
jgi:hypothetical protein